LRRISASSVEAESAISSSPTMDEVIFSSRNLLARRAENRLSMLVRPTVSSETYPRTSRAHCSTPAMSMSSLVLRLPPRSALERDARTSRTPENDGLPRTTIMVLAAVVSSSRRFTSALSAAGRSSRAFSLAVELTHWAESMSSTVGSSSVFNDFSARSLYSIDVISPFSSNRESRSGARSARADTAPLPMPVLQDRPRLWETKRVFSPRRRRNSALPPAPGAL